MFLISKEWFKTHFAAESQTFSNELSGKSGFQDTFLS